MVTVIEEGFPLPKKTKRKYQTQPSNPIAEHDIKIMLLPHLLHATITLNVWRKVWWWLHQKHVWSLFYLALKLPAKFVSFRKSSMASQLPPYLSLAAVPYVCDSDNVSQPLIWNVWNAEIVFLYICRNQNIKRPGWVTVRPADYVTLDAAVRHWAQCYELPDLFFFIHFAIISRNQKSLPVIHYYTRANFSLGI